MELRVNINDSAEIFAYVYEDSNPVQADDLLTVIFNIEKPDNTRVTEEGIIEEDGAGYLLFNDTDQVGEYLVTASFTYTTGKIKTEYADFEVFDPFDPVSTRETLIEQLVWRKLNDLFDTKDGGPWLREMTTNVFERNDVSEFVDEALLEINVNNPPTEFDEGLFVLETKDTDGTVLSTTANSNTQILVLGTFLAVVRHLMRSYVEQPLPTGGQVTYEDRRDYLQRWGTIYQIESQRYDGLLKLWKRRYLDLNKGKVLISNKAGRLTPAPLRSRNIGRGYY